MQQITPETRPLPPAMRPATCTDDCAWGLKERGIAPGEGSHGICAFHKAQMLAQAARLRAARAAQRRARAAAAACQCKTTPGGTVVCDACASKQVETANSLLGHETTKLPFVLAPNESAAMASQVNAWLDTLKEGAPA